MQAFHLVGPLRRLQALAIDLVWLLAVSLPWCWASNPPDAPLRGWMLAGGIVLLSLGAVPCWLWLGATPGQLLMTQRVVDAGGAPHLSLAQASTRWAMSWVGLLPAGLGLLWMCADPRRQGWQDMLARTLVVEPGPDEVAAATTITSSAADYAALQDREPTLPYVRRHLDGALPLGQSLWINGLLLPLPLVLVLGAIEAWTVLHAGGLRLGSLALLLGWPLLLLVLLWALTGVWRAAGRQRWTSARRQGVAATAATTAATTPAGAAVKAAARAVAARTLMSLVLLAGVLHVGLNIGPGLLERGALVMGSEPLGALDARVSSDGRRLHLKGPLGLGAAARVQALLAGSPNLRWVAIESTSGRLSEALQIADLVRERGLPTRASGECSDVCPFVFLAAAQRHLLPGARLGLHRLSAGSFNPPFQGLVNREFRVRLIAAGLTRHLATKAIATPPTAMWYPDGDELAAAGLVNLPERPLDVDLPGLQGAALADYVEALSASPLWQALERRFGGAQIAAAARMHAAGGDGADAVQAAGHEVVAALLPAVLSQASHETRWLFTEILLAQIDALRLLDAAACRDLLLGDPVAHRRLPPALAWRQAQWLLGALGEAPRSTPPRRPTTLELEVIRRTLGSRAPAQLDQLWRPAVPTATEPDCRVAHALLYELGSLPAPERRLALRLMYERE